MAYTWGATTWGAGTFEGQLYIDAQGAIFAWNATNKAWIKKPTYRLREVFHMLLDVFERPSNGILTARRGGQWWNETFNPGGNSWDKAFIQLDSIDGLWSYRVACVDSSSNFQTLVQAAYPSGAFSTNIVARVFEVVDPAFTAVNSNTWNLAYTRFRGSRAGRGSNKGRRDSALLPTRAGYMPTFASNHGNLTQRLIQHFYTYTMALDEPRVCWTTASRHGLYNQPKSTGTIVSPRASTQAGRYAWNSTTYSYQALSTGDQWEIDPTAVGSGVAIVTVPSTGASTVAQPNSALRGLSGLLADGYRLIAYAVRSITEPHKKAFYIKPYGITHISYYLSQAIQASDFDFIAESVFQGESTTVRRKTVTALTSLMSWTGTVLPDLQQCLTPALSRLKPSAQSVDSLVVPETLQFYIRNKTTGLRSEVFDQKVYISRRKSNFPIGFLPFKGGSK